MVFLRALLIGCFALCAGQSHGQNSIFWEISGNHLAKSSYLYGTIHLSDARVRVVDSSVIEKLKASDALALEIIPDSGNVLSLISQLVMPDKKAISQFLTEKEYKHVDSALINRFGVGLMVFDKMLPLIVATMLEESEAEETDAPVIPDVYFLLRARSIKKRVIGLETAESQIEVLKSIPIEKQIEILKETIDNKESNVEELETLINLYRDQNCDKLQAYIGSSGLDIMSVQALLDNRNRVMLNGIMSRIHSASLFIAVGAGHLGGEDGLITLLRNNGYTLTPLPVKFKK